jgi:hypothetical protein
MCAICSLKAVYRFPSAASFEAFDVDLTHRLTTQQLTAVPLPAALAGTQASAAFICAGYQEVWILSDPDNAWRGFFLPQTAAIRQIHSSTNTVTTTRRLGCLVVVAVLVLLCIWRWG